MTSQRDAFLLNILTLAEYESSCDVLFACCSFSTFGKYCTKYKVQNVAVIGFIVF